MDFLGRSRVLYLTALCLVFASYSFPAKGDVFSPGPLARAHQFLEGLPNCDKCHGSSGVEARRCLSCHSNLAERIAKKKGFHGRVANRRTECASCHRDHQGADKSLISEGRPGAAAFNHAETGWPLKGRHAGLSCAKCHDGVHFKDSQVAAYARKHPGTHSRLGLGTACTDCHFDEHRGQLGKNCANCHNEDSWKKTTSFRHDRVYLLKGAHARVACSGCHPEKSEKRSNAWPSPKKDTWLIWKPILHAQCTDCHTDVHRGRFGADCQACHTQESWQIADMVKVTDTGFHDRTAFPLKGRHRGVPCERCHPIDASGKKQLSSIPHDRCGRCHPSGHPDIPDEEMARKDCRDCHSESGYAPSRMTVSDHDRTSFSLNGPHRNVACPECHLGSLGKPLVSETGARSGFRARRVTSPWRMRASGMTPDSCELCHRSPHRDQFSQPCLDCHAKDTFDIVDFDHTLMTSYPLNGRHETLPCNACHFSETDDAGTFVRYAPINHQDCVDCHSDIHAGQFRVFQPVLSCAKCHAETGFKPVLFEHNRSTFSDFVLKGAHSKVACGRCHPRLPLKGTGQVTAYRNIPKSCEGCHEDYHQGSYQQADALIAESLSARAVSSLPAQKKSSSQKTACVTCHAEENWKNSTFNHSVTGFALRGAHTRQPCEKCHKNRGRPVKSGDRNTLPITCEGCHRDPHQGTAGNQCAECHNEDDFKLFARVFPRHNRTRFPLVGRHGVLPCTECHENVRDVRFDQTPSECIACHMNDIPDAAGEFDHASLGTDCKRCHTPNDWSTAGYAGHERCFNIGTFTHHGSVDCQSCHLGPLPAPDGSCDGDNFSCTQCHGCETGRHQGMAGYSCEEVRCASCHKDA